MSSTLSVNPYLPSWEYIPDGEPHIFGDRVYVYGSHDRFNGWDYCLNDYVCWSAPTNDLSEWRYEGVIYRRTQDPRNRDGRQCLYAPDVTQGPDGRYYLYYVLNQENVVSVAVCDQPAGAYSFYGYVHDESDALLGERPGDEPQFDPGVLTEGERTYLYTGFCAHHNRGRHGPMATVLGPDMVTMLEEPVFIAPGMMYSQGSGYEGHEYFEAASMRKVGDKYYFIYSSIRCVELCYAVSDQPTAGFRYGGVIIANDDTGYAAGKPGDKPMYFGANNHGSIIEIEGQWYIFYHRHTNGTGYSRQACLEPIRILPDGTIPQVEMTSCRGIPLPGAGRFPGYIACNVYRLKDDIQGVGGAWMDGRFPKITQDGRDGDEEPGYIANLGDGWIAGFKYFDCRQVRRISACTRGNGQGCLTVRLRWDGEIIARIPLPRSDFWMESDPVDVHIPDGLQGIYLGFEGSRAVSLASFTLYT